MYRYRFASVTKISLLDLELFLRCCIFCFVLNLLCNVWNFRATSKFPDSSLYAVSKPCSELQRFFFSYESNEGKSGHFGVKYGKMRDTLIKVNKH